MHWWKKAWELPRRTIERNRSCLLVEKPEYECMNNDACREEREKSRDHRNPAKGLNYETPPARSKVLLSDICRRFHPDISSCLRQCAREEEQEKEGSSSSSSYFLVLFSYINVILPPPSVKRQRRMYDKQISAHSFPLFSLSLSPSVAVSAYAFSPSVSANDEGQNVIS